MKISLCQWIVTVKMRKKLDSWYQHLNRLLVAVLLPTEVDHFRRSFVTFQKFKHGLLYFWLILVIHCPAKWFLTNMGWFLVGFNVSTFSPTVLKEISCLIYMKLITNYGIFFYFFFFTSFKTFSNSDFLLWLLLFDTIAHRVMNN